MNHSSSVREYGTVGNVLIYFCGVGLAVSSAVKFLRPVGPVSYMAWLGYEHGTLFFIAALELLIAVLFLIPAVRSVGLLLVSASFGGAIAAHLANHAFSGGGPFVTFNAYHPYLGTLPATVFLLSSWIGVWLRHPESFWSPGGKKNGHG